MKHILHFILALASSWTLACGPYYPYREAVRFSLLDPNVFEISQYNAFYYSANYYSFNPGEEYSEKSSYNLGSGTSLNLDLWVQRTGNQSTKNDVYQAVYVMDQLKDSLSSSNSFIQYLVKNKDIDAIDYLNFAQHCSKYNGTFEDPWERNRDVASHQRNQLIEHALTKIKTTNDIDIKNRYAFIAIRLAYYNKDDKQIESIYKSHFNKGRTNLNIIDYWAMYFYNTLNNGGAEKNYYVSKVFTHAPDKRFVSYRQYDLKTPINQTLEWAKNDQEKAAIWLMEGIHKPSKSISIMEKIYQLDPKSEGLSFLLLREVNKLEDWIFTPYYSNFEPSISSEEENNFYDSYRTSQKRIASDRVYAAQVLNFVNQVNLNHVKNSNIWLTAKAYLNFMTNNFKTALNTIDLIENKQTIQSDGLTQLLSMIKALCLTKQQPNGSAIIVDEIKTTLMDQDQKDNNQFLFAIARELEYKGNSTDAAIIMSNMYAQYDWQSNQVYWKTKLRHITLYADFYDHYIFYLDAQYTPKQMKGLIASINNNKDKTDDFNRWKYKAIKYDIPRLYDLTGTKYIRKNELSEALTMFKMVDDTLWISDHFSFKRYLDANPFYANMYSGHEHVKEDSVTYNKETLVQELINHLQKAEHPDSKNSDYHYFSAANCYYNMTYHGNSWMMRRYFWTRNNRSEKLEDDDEYQQANMAKYYYLKAGESSQSDKFSALCLRMAGRCEQYRLRDQPNYHYKDDLLKINEYYLQIEHEYPAYYDDLISNCSSFNEYFNSRN